MRMNGEGASDKGLLVSATVLIHKDLYSHNTTLTMQHSTCKIALGSALSGRLGHL